MPIWFWIVFIFIGLFCLFALRRSNKKLSIESAGEPEFQDLDASFYPDCMGVSDVEFILTDWYGADQKPHRPGLYKTRFMMSRMITQMMVWDGSNWIYEGGSPSTFQFREWCGSVVPL